VPPEVLQQLYLAQRTLRQDLLAEDIGNLLDRNSFLCLGVGRSTVGRIDQLWVPTTVAYAETYQTIPYAP